MKKDTFRVVSDGPIVYNPDTDTLHTRLAIDEEEMARVFGRLSKKEQRNILRQVGKKIGILQFNGKL